MKANKILWAFNPFQEQPKLLHNTIALLRSLSRRGFAIEPVYVVSPAEVNVVLEFSVPAEERFHSVALAYAQTFLRKVKVPGLKTPKILVENQFRLSASAMRLSAYARKSKAAAIVAGTQAKHGLGRAVLGSFAETLLFHTKTPVLLVNPQAKKPRSLKKFLFASDLNSASRKAFEKFCAFAKALQASVVLYHVLPKPFPWAAPAADFLFAEGKINAADFLALENQARLKAAKPFLRIADRHRVKTSLRIEKSDTDVTEAILSQAKKTHNDAIAMAAHSGLLRSTLLGAASRGVLRKAPIPVWILRTS